MTQNEGVEQPDLVMESIGERDCDLLLVEELCASSEFLSLFVAPLRSIQGISIPTSDPKQFIARHSINRDDGSCETDIEVSVKWEVVDHPLTALLLVENKIDAPFQPDQPGRYVSYAQQLMESEVVDLAFTFLVAPQQYLDSTQAEFDTRVSYEDIIAYFERRASGHAEIETRRRSTYRAQWFEQAVKKLRRGNTVTIDPNVSNFWTDYWAIANRDYSALQMEAPTGKPRDAVWVPFHQSLPRPRSLGYVAFNHKLKNGWVDILVEKMDRLPEEVWTELEGLLVPPMVLRKAGKSLAISIRVPLINPTLSAQGQLSEVREALGSASLLRQWWIDHLTEVETLLAPHAKVTKSSY
jgi:hypothetical protein